MAEALGWPDEPLGFADILALSQDPAGLGRPRPPRVGPVPARQDQPELLHQRPVGPRRPGLRRQRQDRGPVGRGPGQAEHRRVRPADRVGRRPLRRHHADVPQQLVPGRPARQPVPVRVGGRRRGEVGDRLQLRQPRRRAPGGRGAPRAERAARGDLPGGGHALLRQPPLRARRRVGRRRRGRRRRAVHRLRPAAARTRSRSSGTASGPGTPTCRSAARSTTATASTPTSPRRCSRCPQPEVLTQLLDDWQDQRKPARVLLLVDVSGSMSEVADPDTGATKLDLAKQATITALDEFNDDDEVGLWVFSTDLGTSDDPEGQYLELVPDRTDRRRAREPQDARSATCSPPTARRSTAPPRLAYEQQLDGVRPHPHQRGRAAVRRRERRRRARRRPRPARGAPVGALATGPRASRARPCACSRSPTATNADLPTLRRIAEASQAALYDSSDPRSINKVFVAVVSNF